MKLNGYTIKSFKNFYVAVDNNNKNIIRYDKDVNRLINTIMKIIKERENEES